MKKGVLVLAVAVLCCAGAVMGTVAYFTSVDTATNVITVGNVRIALLERSGEMLVPFIDVVGAMPGETVSKIVQVENIGTQPAWIRIRVETAISLAEGIGDPEYITLDWNREYWLEQDGYFYYNSVLQPGELTQPLFRNVYFSADMDNAYQNSQVEIQVLAQATQSANNGDTVWKVTGWPE